MYYLVEFNDQINKIVKTHGLSLNNDGTFRIDYIEEPTQDQINSVNQLIEKYPLFCKKMEKLAQIDKDWQEVLSGGWDSGQGVLGISAEDVALLSANFSMAKEAANLGYPIPPIITLDNQEISFSNIQTLTTFMLQYGQYRSNISSVFAAKRRAVENATTISELDNL